jgi:hypothetical protein
MATTPCKIQLQPKVEKLSISIEKPKEDIRNALFAGVAAPAGPVANPIG